MKIEKQFQNGLVLLQANDGTLIYRFKYVHRGNRRTVFIGKHNEISESKAFERAIICRDMLKNGIDPKFNRDFLEK